MRPSGATGRWETGNQRCSELLYDWIIGGVAGLMLPLPGEPPPGNPAIEADASPTYCPVAVSTKPAWVVFWGLGGPTSRLAITGSRHLVGSTALGLATAGGGRPLVGNKNEAADDRRQRQHPGGLQRRHPSTTWGFTRSDPGDRYRCEVGERLGDIVERGVDLFAELIVDRHGWNSRTSRPGRRYLRAR